MDLYRHFDGKYPRIFDKKMGLCVTVRRPSVRLSVRPKPICIMPLCIQMLATYL